MTGFLAELIASQSLLPQAAKKVQSFFPVTCASEKILLGLPVCPKGARSRLQTIFSKRLACFGKIIYSGSSGSLPGGSNVEMEIS